jgi:hypothetical protein
VLMGVNDWDSRSILFNLTNGAILSQCIRWQSGQLRWNSFTLSCLYDALHERHLTKQVPRIGANIDTNIVSEKRHFSVHVKTQFGILMTMDAGYKRRSCAFQMPRSL